MTRRRFLLGTAAAAGILGGGAWQFLNGMQFGSLPQQKDMARILRSPHFQDGVFCNELPTPVMTENQSMVSSFLEFALTRRERAEPQAPVPTVRSNLKNIGKSEDVAVWLGHSSFFLQLGGFRILLDPVLSDHAAPVSFSTKAFKGSNLYVPDDFPDIDFLLISHDHWDHLDYPTLQALRPRIGTVVCGLGVGASLRRWGFTDAQLHECDWGDSITQENLTIYVTTARHYSGRSLTRNKTLWTGFVLETPQKRVFFSGDSGYGTHFAELGKKFGSFDLALLDCGQYNEKWKYIHMMPEETAQAAADLHSRVLLPAHAGKFSIAYHAWDDPYKRIYAASKNFSYSLATPKIGEIVRIGEKKSFEPWWEHVEK